MSRPIAAALVFAAALVTSSCGPAAPPPTLTIPLGTNDFGGFALLVYDSSGIVTDGRTLVQPPGLPDIDGVVALPERRELEVWWLGGACSHRPTLHVSGDATSLRLVLSSPPEPQLPLMACPSVGLRFGVALSLSEAVAEGEVLLDVNY